MSLSFQRIDNLAKRLGITFREAAVLCGRKGSRKRRERQCACSASSSTEQRIQAARWDLKDNL